MAYLEQTITFIGTQARRIIVNKIFMVHQLHRLIAFLSMKYKINKVLFNRWKNIRRLHYRASRGNLRSG